MCVCVFFFKQYIHYRTCVVKCLLINTANCQKCLTNIQHVYVNFSTRNDERSWLQPVVWCVEHRSCYVYVVRRHIHDIQHTLCVQTYTFEYTPELYLCVGCVGILHLCPKQRQSYLRRLWRRKSHLITSTGQPSAMQVTEIVCDIIYFHAIY